MIRVLHTYKTFRPDATGGVAEVISTIVWNLKGNFRHAILVARERGGDRSYFDQGLPVQAVGSFGLWSSMPIAPRYPKQLIRALKQSDLVVHHAPFPLADMGLLFRRRNGPRLIVHWHAEVVRSSLSVAATSILVSRSLQQASAIIVSDQCMIERSQLLGRFAEKCVIIPYAADCRFWSELTEDERIQVRSLRSQYPDLIVTTGRLVPYKGHDVLLEAMQNVQASLVVIGAGPLQHRLRAMAASLGLQSRVHFLGHQPRERLKLFLHAGKIFAFPSTSIAESFGIAQVEAMAAGLPIVNTKLATAVPRVARHELEALTVEPGDSTALASALSRLLANPALAFRLGTAAKARAHREYDQQPFLTRIRKVYQDAMSHDAKTS